ncbi:hypothetical protein F5Y13DRAFT_109259 [Hypoxylon sp. FL1857]|nr:hypothetical protein F5Y13DRAFT_109259 [Hypoxylon sp. FL1857]
MSDTSCSEAIPKVEPKGNVFKLLQLPVELVLIISEFLPQEDEVCLALTCTSLLCLLGDAKTMQLEPSAKETLLCRLEPEVPGVVYCHFCRKLVPFNGDAPAGIDGLRLNRLSPTQFANCACSSMVSFSGSSFKLPYYLARLATNYQLFGPEHGIPLSYLSYEYQHPYHTYVPLALQLPWSKIMVSRTETATAKLIDNELFISCTYKLFHEEADANALHRYIITTPFYICKHITVGALRRNTEYDVDLPTMTNSRPTDSRHQKTGSCHFCTTDWDTLVEWVDSKCGWVITVTTYHELGHCRSPYDRIWQDIARPPLRLGYRDAPRGAIKERWLRG